MKRALLIFGTILIPEMAKADDVVDQLVLLNQQMTQLISIMSVSYISDYQRLVSLMLGGLAAVAFIKGTGGGRGL